MRILLSETVGETTFQLVKLGSSDHQIWVRYADFNRPYDETHYATTGVAEWFFEKLIEDAKKMFEPGVDFPSPGE